MLATRVIRFVLLGLFLSGFTRYFEAYEKLRKAAGQR